LIYIEGAQHDIKLLETAKFQNDPTILLVNIINNAFNKRILFFAIGSVLFDALILMVLIILYHTRKTLWYFQIKNIDSHEYIKRIAERLKITYDVRIENDVLLIEINNKTVIIGDNSAVSYRLINEPHIITIFPNSFPDQIKENILLIMDNSAKLIPHNNPL
jgi:acetyltransferase-like isoleucine patch superfamily enzyme